MVLQWLCQWLEMFVWVWGRGARAAARLQYTFCLWWWLPADWTGTVTFPASLPDVMLKTKPDMGATALFLPGEPRFSSMEKATLGLAFASSVVAALSYWDGMKPSVDYYLPKVLIITQNDQSHNRTATYVFICWSFMIQEIILCQFWRMLVFLTLLTRTYGMLVYFVMPLSLFHTGARIGAGKFYLSMVQVWALPKSSFYLRT